MSEQLLTADVTTKEDFILDRRSSPRYQCGRPILVRLLARPSYRCFHAGVHDVYVDSIGLLLESAFEPGTSLAIQAQSKRAGFSGILTATVRHSTPQPDGRWLVGCKLSRSLTDDELFALL